MVGSHKYMLLLALVDCLFHKQTSSYAFSYTEEYEEFCQQSCSNTDLVPTYKCNACFCDDNCSVLGDCCPDKNETPDDDYSSSCQRVIFPELSKKTKINSETCSSTYTGHSECSSVIFQTYENGYKLVTSCLSDFDDPETRRLCQGIDPVLPSTIRPVTDMDTGLSFRNIHCSKCNRVTSNLKMWPLWVICRNEIPDRIGNSLQQLHHAIKNTEGCSIRFAAAHDNERMCKADEIIIETCNVTGKWSGQDTTLPSKCSDASYHNEVQGYRNMFCFFCNTDDSNTMALSDQTTSGDMSEEIFGIVNDDVINYPIVNYSIADSYTGRCRRIMCPDGRQYVNGSCQSLFNRFNGYLYTFCLRMEVGVPKNDDFTSTSDIKDAFSSQFRSYFLTDDRFETMTSNNTLVKIGLCPEGFINATIEFALYLTTTQSSMSEDESIRSILSKVKEIKSNSLATFEILKVNQKSHCSSEELDEEESSVVCLPYVPPRPRRSYARNRYLGYLYVSKKVVVSKFFMCPQVMLEANEVDYDSEKNEITILANNRSVTEVNFQFTNGSYYICMEDYTKNNTEAVETEVCETDFTAKVPTSTIARLSEISYIFLLLEITGIYMCTCYRV